MFSAAAISPVEQEATLWRQAISGIQIPMESVVRMAREMMDESSPVVMDDITVNSLKDLCLLSVLAKSVADDQVFDRLIDAFRVAPRGKIERGFLLDALRQLLDSKFLVDGDVPPNRVQAIQGRIAHVV